LHVFFPFNIRNHHYRVKDFSSPVVKSAVLMAPILPSVQSKETKVQNESIKGFTSGCL
jgi:hypothetical protein